ncbi:MULTISPECIES: VanZ family protein [Lysinibacillus]|uniref:VanZ family protein n=1 Tax=Lysinibacillus TaxID=400634 RepID=UPI00257B2289|nr:MULTISPECIES: VanZ family protein [Lysinibacillus]
MNYFIDFTLLLLIYFLFFYKKWINESKQVFVIKTLMYLYVVMVLFVTLMPFILPFGGTNNLFMQTANLIPFRDLLLNHDRAVREIILNIIMMMPFGFLYPIIKRKGVLGTIVITFLFSLTIECSQLLSAWWGGIYSRNFDVTDLITNTIGGLIGYYIFITLRPTLYKVLDD